MDPNATLERLREIVQWWNGGDADASDLETAVELVESLDQWLSNGGFVPKDWASEEWK